MILQQVLKLSFCVYHANRKLLQYYSSKSTRDSEPLEFPLVIYLKYWALSDHLISIVIKLNATMGFLCLIT